MVDNVNIEQCLKIINSQEPILKLPLAPYEPVSKQAESEIAPPVDETNNSPINFNHKKFPVTYVLPELGIQNNESLNTIFRKNISKSKIPPEVPEGLLNNLPLKDPTINYESQLRSLAIANSLLREEIQELTKEKDELKASLQKIEESNIARRDENLKELPEKEVKRSYPRQEMQMVWEKGRKRHRRNATEIQRPYKCPYSPCNKAYGSEGSLNQHIKLKHPQYVFGTSR